MSNTQGSQAKSSNPEMQALVALRRMKARLETIEQAQHEPIAIVGIGCRFPGNIQGPEAFWEFLRNGGDAISEVPENRWKLSDADATSASERKIVRWGGFLKNIDQFDASFFGIAPREAMYMDPQQRILLEVCWEALENAMLAPDRLTGTRTGVFVGVSNSEYAHFQYQDSPHKDPYLTTGTSYSILANRISYFFDFSGPSLAVDTACSSSLVALHIGSQALRNHECELALVGGVNLLMTVVPSEAFSTWGMLAVDGSCKTFDAQANGFVRSEGCAVIVLKRLSDAQAAGDHILALVRGSAINQDGHSNGLTAPNVLSQQAVLRQALQNARIQAEEVSYVETHGTGTPLGDPIEVEALAAVYGHKAQGRTVTLGAVKTNIGHMEAASGMVGVIKAILALQHQEIPPNLHFQTLNPNISFKQTPFVLPLTRQSWKAGEKPRYAGVSSFGFGGTNAHVILAEAALQNPAEAMGKDERTPFLLLPLSARSAYSLHALASSYEQVIASATENTLPAIVYNAGEKRSHHSFRLAVCGHSAQELTAGLSAFLQGNERTGLSSGQVEATFKPSLVFVFPGQGSQWTGMGRQLLQHESVFREMLERCEEAMRPYISWSLLDILRGQESSEFERVDVIQPMLFAIQVALVALWRSWGLEPDTVIGHSMGEVAAAYVAGILSLQDACRVICLRSQLLRRVHGQGAMAVVELSFEQARQAIQGYEQLVSVAVSNSRRSTVLSGDPTALQAILDTLEQRGVFCKHVRVDVASHSPQMEVLRTDLLSALAGIQPQKAQISLYSTVTVTRVHGSELNASYWVENLRQPVLFAPAIQQLIKEEHVHFLEMSAHPLLVSSIEEELRDAQKSGISLASLRRNMPEQEMLTLALAALYSQGYIPRWSQFFSTRPAASSETLLPTYPWQHERFWVEEKTTPKRRSAIYRNGAEQHPLLGSQIASALTPQTHYWQTHLEIDALPYLRDHQIQDQTILAGAVSMEMALAAGKELFGAQRYSLEAVTFDRMLRFDDVNAPLVQLVLTESTSTLEQASFQLFSSSVQSTRPRSPQWLSHVKGTVRPLSDLPSEQPVRAILSERAILQASCDESLPQEAVYQHLQAGGLAYGRSFQSVQHVWKNEGTVLARLDYPADIKAEIEHYHIHPVILDGCFQVLALVSSLVKRTDDGIYVPIGVDRYTQFADLSEMQGPFWVSAQLAFKEDASSSQQPLTITGKLLLTDDLGRTVLEIHGLHIQRIQALPAARASILDKWCYEIHWQAQRREDATSGQKPGGENTPAPWLLFATSSTGQHLKTLLAQRGQHCILIEPGETYQQISEDIFHLNPTRAEDFQRVLKESSQTARYRGIVHLWSLDNPSPTVPTISLQTQERGYGSVLLLVQALALAGLRDLPRLWLVTSGTQSIEPQMASRSSIMQAPLWGLGRTVMFEYPGLRCSLVDIADQERASSSLVEELLVNSDENQIVLRDTQRYVARLLPTSLQVQDNEARTESGDARALFSPNHTYMISGGTGGLGLTLARWMGTQGVRSLVLVSRSGASPQTQEVLTELQEAGVQVNVALKDISQADQVADLLHEIAHSGMPLRGIVHAAAVLDDATLLNQTFQRFQKVTAPKMPGAWNLHQQTADLPLDFFILFSSVASLIGSAGQGNYAAANAFLDALAHYRRGLGLPALSINWGPWAEVGQAARPDRNERLAWQGMESMRPEDGIAAFAAALSSTKVQVAILPLHIRRWRQIHPRMARLPLLSQLRDEEPASQSGEQQQTLRTDLQAVLPGPERRKIFEAFLLQQVLLVLRRTGTAVDKETPFSVLGMDSMMAMELRNRLEGYLKLTLPTTLIWSYPTIHALSTHLSELLGIVLDAVASEAREHDASSDRETLQQAALMEIDGRSENELLQLLVEELSNRDKRDKK